MPKLICPYCETQTVRPANFCLSCNAKIIYGAIPEDTVGFILVCSLISAVVAMEACLKLGIPHPFVVLFIVFGASSFIGFWRASSRFEDRVTWKKARPPVGDGQAMDGILNLKIKHGFEFYYRNRYGYYPAWDEQTGQYSVAVAQDKWSSWEAFFQKRRKVVLDGITPYEMVVSYLSK